MSAIATLRIAPATLLEELEANITDFYSLLAKTTNDNTDFSYNGWILATLLPVLSDEYGIHLMRAHPDLTAKLSRDLGSTVFLFTSVEKRDFADRLDPVFFSPEKLQHSYEVFNTTAADGVGQVMLDGIGFIRAGLGRIKPDTIAFLTIG